MSNSDDSDDGYQGSRPRNSTVRGRGSSNAEENVSQSIELEGTGIAHGHDDLDGFRQPTAMFDRGEFLGELGAELNQTPETRVKVEAEKPPRGFRLIVVAGPGVGTEWAFKQSEITIGRSAENEIDFADIAVSRQHTKVICKDQVYYVRDLSSNNGTLLNGIRVTEERLHSGDELIIGERTLRFVELNEAPLTGAAHPNVSLSGVDGDDALDGEALQASEDSDEEGLHSQLNVDVVPDYDGPSVSDSVSAAVIVTAPRARRTGLKVIGLAGLALLLITCIGFLGVRAYQGITGTSPEDLRKQAHVYFLQAIELTKEKRCGDALILLEEVERVRPEYSRAKEYIAYCRKEIAAYQDLQSAKSLEASGETAKAISMLSNIPKDSQYAVSVTALKTEWTKVDHRAQIRNAKLAISKKRIREALEILDDVLKQSPDHSEAQALRSRVRSASATSNKSISVSPTEIPTALTRAVRLYRAGKITQALDAAELARSEKAARYLESLKQMQASLVALKRAHRQKAGADIIQLAPELLKIDKKLGFGQGVIRPSLKKIYADGLYLKGLEAYTEEDFSRAYKLFRKAVKFQTNHRLSKTYLDTLSRKARVMYYEAYVLKDSDKAEAARIFKEVVGITPASNQFHKLAKKWLKANR